MKKLFGVTTAMTTAFDSNNSVDVEAIKRHTEFLIGKGVNCLYPLGTTGEMYLMSTDERKLVAETVVEAANGRAIVYIHVGATTLDETISLAKHAQQIGADGVGVLTPSYFIVNDRAMIEYYKSISAALDKNFPIYAYAFPALAHNDLTAETMAAIYNECENVIGIKYTDTNMIRISEYLAIDPGKFSVLTGSDRLFLPALAMGCDGIVSGCSSAVPEPFVEIYRHFRSGNLEEAKKAHLRSAEVIQLLKAGSDLSVFKQVLTKRGISGGQVRKPLLNLDSVEAAQIFDRLKARL